MQIRKLIKKLKRQLKKHLRLKRNKRRIYYIFSSSLIFFLSFGLISSQINSAHLAKLKQSKEQSLRATYKALEAVKAEKATTEQEVKQKAAHEAELQSQVDKLNQQLQAKKEQQNVLAKVFAPAQASAASGCGSDPYLAFIYEHESGCSTTAINSIGCRGLGQACPGDKLPCGADFACQDSYFRSYAISRYGSTYNAMVAWQSKGFW